VNNTTKFGKILISGSQEEDQNVKS
jgi:hypothetical protein